MYFRKGDKMMKKSKLSIGLVTSFIGALALTACNEATPAVTSSSSSIIDFISYNSESDKIEINTDTYYREYCDGEDGTTKFYNAILEALTRYEYPKLSDTHTNLRPYSVLEKEAKDKCAVQIQIANDNAKTNGTSYEAEWDKILESFNVDSYDDLLQHYLYELEKDALKEWYLKENSETKKVGETTVYSLQDQYLGLDKDWAPVAESEKYDSVFPYHIVHVLVKLDADASDYSRATMTADQAKKLWLVVRELLDNRYDFADVAKDLSDDGSKDEYGDVGTMSKKTSFYNEFKLGIYAVDGHLSGINDGTTENEKALRDAFGISGELEGEILEDQATGTQKESTPVNVTDAIDSEMVNKVRTAITGYGADKFADPIPTVPYDVFRLIGESADEDKVGGKMAPEAGDVALPRNVYFNEFLNFRSPFLITGEDVTGVEADGYKVTTAKHDFTATSGDKVLTIPAANLNIRYGDEVDKYFTGLTATTKTNGVLTDNNGNIVIGVRSTAGIHFMVMRKSPFYKTNYNKMAIKMPGATEAEIKANIISLQDFYTTKDVNDPNYPAETYVKILKSDDPTYYTNRIEKLKDKYKGQDGNDVYDAAFDYRIYEMLLGELGDKVKFVDEKEGSTPFVRSNIANKIKLLREKQKLDNDKSLNDSWKEYIEQLKQQNEKRMFKGMLKTTCAFNFSVGDETNLAKYKKDGECYVK